MADCAAGKNHSGEVRFNDQAPPDVLHDQSHFSRAAAKSAVILGEGHTKPTQLREVAPMLLTKAQLGAG